jgi:hypothetical protein
MDYNSVTSSDVEWRWVTDRGRSSRCLCSMQCRSAVCLCGMRSCRGSFLHYATQEDLQQVSVLCTLLSNRLSEIFRF